MVAMPDSSLWAGITIKNFELGSASMPIVAGTEDRGQRSREQEQKVREARPS